jgi:hypothetical protein
MNDPVSVFCNDPQLTQTERLYILGRLPDLLCYRADRLNPGPRRNAIIERIEALNIAFVRNL